MYWTIYPAMSLLSSEAPLIQRDVHVRRPHLSDGIKIHDFIDEFGGLDANSLYCNLLQTHHFAETSAVAFQSKELVGFATGYIIPKQPHTLFIWQVAVSPEARGQGLGKDLLLSILRRNHDEPIRYLKATITPANAPSWKLFESVAEHFNTYITEIPLFDEVEHFQNRHETEYEIQIGPFHSHAA